MYLGSGWLTNLSGLNMSSDNFVYSGSSGQDTLNLNIDRATYTRAIAINAGAGDDSLLSAKLINTDQISLGAGNDTIAIMVGSVGSLNLALLDGGSGTDTLGFEESTISNGQTLTLTTGGAVNFENLKGSSANETLQGDSGDNVLTGLGGTDTLTGGAGNDTLYASDSGGAGTGDDSLSGGSGNDILVGSAGANILDGGTGADRLTGGSGADTFVLRAGDGGDSIGLADTITDFNVAADLLQLSGFNRSQLSITLQSGNSVIMFGSEYIALVVGVAPSQLINSVFTS